MGECVYNVQSVRQDHHHFVGVCCCEGRCRCCQPSVFRSARTKANIGARERRPVDPNAGPDQCSCGEPRLGNLCIYIYAFLCLSNLSVFSIHSCTFQVTLALLVQQQPMATRLRAASVVQKPRLKPRQLRSLWSPRRWMSKWTRRAASLEVLLFVFPFGASSYSILFPLDWSESEAQI